MDEKKPNEVEVVTAVGQSYAPKTERDRMRIVLSQNLMRAALAFMDFSGKLREKRGCGKLTVTVQKGSSEGDSPDLSVDFDMHDIETCECPETLEQRKAMAQASRPSSIITNEH